MYSFNIFVKYLSINFFVKLSNLLICSSISFFPMLYSLLGSAFLLSFINARNIHTGGVP